MNNQQVKKIANMNKKVGCILTDCGQHFTFAINENTLALGDNNKKMYVGKCVRCHKSIKLKANALPTFQAAYGKTNFEVMKSSFNNLFEIEKDKN